MASAAALRARGVGEERVGGVGEEPGIAAFWLADRVMVGTELPPVTLFVVRATVKFAQVVLEQLAHVVARQLVDDRQVLRGLV